ncbi:MAG: glutamine--tRNA ligase/YqeY domain fusion protein [Longimicrobiales bacterium]
MSTIDLERPGGAAGLDFIRAMVAADNRTGRFAGRVHTRFPPEPNGYLHIGHAKSICLNFGVAAGFGGRCHLRFDDTNPETEDLHYVEAIIRDVKWLGFDWGEHLYFASDYFEAMYEFAERLIRKSKAYIDSTSEEEIREARGTITTPGRPTQYRSRSVDENLDLFRRMRAGEFANGAHVLRARIDLASPNMLMRDPILYRIRHARHYRTADHWCIYPLYDYAHPIEDALECVTHSLCTLEFENNRELYDWVVESIDVDCRPEQTEFARLALDYTVMSKRKLLQLVNGGYVSGWDDPRMPTIAGLRRRGVTPEAIRLFADMIGVAKANSRVDISKLEFAIREDLNRRVRRVLCVLKPLKVTVTNYPKDQIEEFDAPFYPHDVPLEGSRPLPFARELYIDRDDFTENPPRGYFRLAPGAEVRLRYAYIIRCTGVVKDTNGEVIELKCTYDPDTRGGSTPDGRTVKGTIHWVSAQHSLPCEVRLYDRLFRVQDPEQGDDFKDFLNPNSLIVEHAARIEPGVAHDPPGSRYQFERIGYFCSDTVRSKPDALVFNRTVTLRDSWARRVEAKPSEGRPKRAKPEEGKKRRTEGERTERNAPPRERAVSPAEIIARDPALQRLFAAAASASGHPDAIASYVVNELPRELKARTVDQLRFGGQELARLVDLIEDDVITAVAGRDVLAIMAREGGDPADIVERKGLRQIADVTTLQPIIDDVLEANPDKIAAIQSGKVGMIGFFVGQVMAKTGGRAKPEVVKRALEEQLGVGGR